MSDIYVNNNQSPEKRYILTFGIKCGITMGTNIQS